MKSRRFTLLDIATVIMTVVILAMALWVATRAPDVAYPMQFNTQGGVNRWGDRNELAVLLGFMAVMTAVYVLAATRIPLLTRYWWIAGPLYGVGLFIVMYWLVLPARFEGFAPPSEAIGIAKGLFAHCVLVGLPIAWITARARPAIRQSYI